MLLLQSTWLARAYFLNSDQAQLARMLGPAGTQGPRRQVRRACLDCGFPGPRTLCCATARQRCQTWARPGRASMQPLAGSCRRACGPRGRAAGPWWHLHAQSWPGWGGRRRTGPGRKATASLGAQGAITEEDLRLFKRALAQPGRATAAIQYYQVTTCTVRGRGACAAAAGQLLQPDALIQDGPAKLSRLVNVSTRDAPDGPLMMPC